MVIFWSIPRFCPTIEPRIQASTKTTRVPNRSFKSRRLCLPTDDDNSASSSLCSSGWDCDFNQEHSARRSAGRLGGTTCAGPTRRARHAFSKSPCADAGAGRLGVPHWQWQGGMLDNVIGRRNRARPLGWAPDKRPHRVGNDFGSLRPIAHFITRLGRLGVGTGLCGVNKFLSPHLTPSPCCVFPRWRVLIWVSLRPWDCRLSSAHHPFLPAQADANDIGCR